MPSRARRWRLARDANKLGAILAAAPMAKGAAGIGPNAVPERYRNDQTPTLAELGITKKTSARVRYAVTSNPGGPTLRTESIGFSRRREKVSFPRVRGFHGN